ncbi:hypothetical protein Avbf_09017, partial [Armadillidium vulgare]
LPQKTDDGASDGSNICNEEAEETQVERVEEFEVDKFKTEVEVEKSEIDVVETKTEEEITEVELKVDEEVENLESMKVEKDEEEEKWDEDFMSYDEVTEDEFDVRIAEFLIKANEMSIAQESIFDECYGNRNEQLKDHEGECRGENEVNYRSQNDDNEASDENEVIAVENENVMVSEERPSHEVNAAHPEEKSSKKDEDKVVVENKEEPSSKENKQDETEEAKVILKDSTTDVEDQDSIVIEDKEEFISKESKDEIEEVELTSKEAADIEEKDEIGIRGKEELIFNVQLLPVLHFKENKDEADKEELQWKQETAVEVLKDEIGIDDKEDFLSKENKEDSFLQILKDLQESESPKGIKEAIEFFEDDEEVFEKAKENEDKIVITEDSKDQNDENEDKIVITGDSKEQNDENEDKIEITEDSKEQNDENEDKIEITEDSKDQNDENEITKTEEEKGDRNASKDEKEILEEGIFTKEIRSEIPEVSEENNHESKIMKDLKETERAEVDKNISNITCMCQLAEALENKDEMEDSEKDEERKENTDLKSGDKNIETTEGIFLNESEKMNDQTDESESTHDTNVLEDGKEEEEEEEEEEAEILVEKEKDELKVNIITENSTEEASTTTEKGEDVTEISEHSEDQRYMEGLNKEDTIHQTEESSFTDVKGEELEIQEEEEESKILKGLTETETSTNNKETKISTVSKDDTSTINKNNDEEAFIKDTFEGEGNNIIMKASEEVTEKLEEKNDSCNQLTSEFKEVHTTNTDGTESGTQNLNFLSQKGFQDFLSLEKENNGNSNTVNKTVIITHDSDYVHNYNEEIQISEVVGKEVHHQQKIEYTEVADEEEVLYRNVVKCGEEEFVEEFQTKNEIFNEKSCTSSVVTNEEISSNQQTTSTTITKVINLSYTAEECSTENFEIRTIIGGDGGDFIPLTENGQFKKLAIGEIKDRISSDGLLKDDVSTVDSVSVENVSNDNVKEFKKPVGGVFLFGGEELLNKIKSRKLIVDGYEREEKQQLENEENWRLSKMCRSTDEVTSNTTSTSTASSTTTTTMTSQMRNQKTQMKQDIKQIRLFSSNAFEKPDVVPVLSANMSQPANKEDPTIQFSESQFQDGLAMTSHNGNEGEIISEIPTFQNESPLIHLNKE